MKRTCTCGQPMNGSATVCKACVADLERALGDVSFYALELEVSFSRQTRMGSTAPKVRGTKDRALPYDPRASRATDDLRNVLTTWIRDLLPAAGAPLAGPTCPTCRHRSCRGIKASRPPGNTMPQMAAWLLLNLDAVRRHEAGWEITASITAAVRFAETVVDLPAKRAYSGPCDHCGTDLYCRLDAAMVRCQECGTEYDVAERREYLRAAVEDVQVNAITAARLLALLGVEVSVDRIRKWAERGHLIPQDVNARGYALYRFGDTFDLLERLGSRPEKISA